MYNCLHGLLQKYLQKFYRKYSDNVPFFRNFPEKSSRNFSRHFFHISFQKHHQMFILLFFYRNCYGNSNKNFFKDSSYQELFKAFIWKFSSEITFQISSSILLNNCSRNYINLSQPFSWNRLEITNNLQFFLEILPKKFHGITSADILKIQREIPSSVPLENTT